MKTHDQQPAEQARARRGGPSDGTAAGRIEVPSVESAGLTAVGTVHLKTSHPPCPSCIEAIHRFRGKHKGVQVVLY